MSGVETFTVSGRDRAVLRAVAAGRCRVGSVCEPVLWVDGMACADSSTGRRLVAAGLVAPPDLEHPLDPARLTPAGLAVLAEGAR